VRCFASLFFTYRKYLNRPTREQKSSGQIYSFDMNGFLRSLPQELQEYATMLKQTQGKKALIHSSTDCSNNWGDSFQRIHSRARNHTIRKPKHPTLRQCHPSQEISRPHIILLQIYEVRFLLGRQIRSLMEKCRSTDTEREVPWRLQDCRIENPGSAGCLVDEGA